MSHPPTFLYTATVRVLRESDDTFLVVHRSHGWLHGDYEDALCDAIWTAGNCGDPVRMFANDEISNKKNRRR